VRHAFLILGVSLVSAALAAASTTACGHGSTSSEDGDAGGTESPVTSASGTNAPASTPVGPTGQAGTGQATGLPCDVQGILENRCIDCHGPTASTASGPPPLLSYSQLVAPSNTDPKKPRAQVALADMLSKTMPPPPAVGPDSDEIAAFQAWVDAGTPENKTACTDPPPAADGGIGGGGLDAGTACTSGKFWTRGDDGSSDMHPGRACNACHQHNDGPNLRLAGTVYSTLHQPDDCDGVTPPPQLQVVVTDAKNNTIKLNVNSAGNFSTTTRVNPPFRALVTDGTKTRQMQGSVTSGDCNSCHTVAGANGAPGRIMAP
jgi:hypothetical protein